MTGLTLDQARRHIGSNVVYRGGASAEDEEGVITAVTDTYVFVRYASQHPDAVSTPTPAQRLELLTANERAREARHTKPLEVPVSGLALNFTALGLDPQDLGWDVDDERVELHAADGPLLVVDGFDGNDPDTVRAVADWFDALALRGQAIANELRDLANSICVDCDGTGLTGPDDADCKACSGYGRLS